ARRIECAGLEPKQRLWLEKLLGGFDVNKMAVDEIYAARFFVERLVTPHVGNPATYAPLADALKSISAMLGRLIGDGASPAASAAAEGVALPVERVA
ncbi:MAG TPA: hypothetical protein VMU42_18260, partial [Candidatus Sulfotelmatobacter sp.]|nr:hypothetical protein [Candidatus Sulfotelmatobacter sp.]